MTDKNALNNEDPIIYTAGYSMRRVMMTDDLDRSKMIDIAGQTLRSVMSCTEIDTDVVLVSIACSLVSIADSMNAIADTCRRSDG